MKHLIILSMPILASVALSAYASTSELDLNERATEYLRNLPPPGSQIADLMRQRYPAAPTQRSASWPVTRSQPYIPPSASYYSPQYSDDEDIAEAVRRSLNTSTSPLSRRNPSAPHSLMYDD